MRSVEALAKSLAPGFRNDPENFKAVLDALPVAVYSTDAAGRITYYNPAAATLWGHEPALGTAQWCGSWKLYWPDGRPLPHDECPMAIALKEQRAVRGVEAIAERPDGTRVPFEPYPTLLFDKSGALTGAVNMLVDITAHKQAQATLQGDILLRRAAEDALTERVHEQAALYRFTDGMLRAGSLAHMCEYAFDAIDRGLHCNRASILLLDDAGVMRFAAWRGLSEGYRHAVDGHSPWTADTLDPEPICIADVANSDLTDELKQTLSAESIAALAFIPLVIGGRLAGKFMAYYDAPRALSPAHIDLAVAIARQLSFGIDRLRSESGRRHAEDELRQLAAIVEYTNDAIISKDLNSIIKSWNRSAEAVFGYTAEEAIGRSVAMLFPEDRISEEYHILDRIRRGEPIEHYETVRRHKDGRLIDVSLTVSPVKDGDGVVIGASKIARDITERKRNEAQRDLLVAELSHRVKNTLATVMSILHQSFSRAPSVEEGRRSFSARIRALAQTHGRLAEGQWTGASLEATFRDELAPYSHEDGSNVRISGPPVLLTPKAAVTVGMAIHELATNAAKYGALSVRGGIVTATWEIDAGGRKLVITWAESGGPPVTPPTRSGFGRVLLERALAADLQGEVQMQFARDGVRCAIILPLDHNAQRAS